MVMRSFRDPILSEDQELIDQNTDAGKPQPYPLNPRGMYPETIDTDNPVGDIILGDADSQHKELVALLSNAAEQTDAILDELGMVGFQIIRLDAGAAPVPLSQHVRMRVRKVIVNPVTAGTLTLTIGTGTFPFDGAARGLIAVPFPLVIERGSDMSCVGTDGRIYLVGSVE